MAANERLHPGGMPEWSTVVGMPSMFLASLQDANDIRRLSGGLRGAPTTGYFLPSLRDESQRLTGYRQSPLKTNAAQ